MTLTLALILFHANLLRIWLTPSLFQRDFIEVNAVQAHAHYRRFSKKYRRRQRIVRSLWTGTGMFMLIFPSLPFIIGSLLFSTFLSFAILDESK